MVLMPPQGDEAFVRGDYGDAIMLYSQSLRHDTHVPTVWSNRAAAHLRQGACSLELCKACFMSHAAQCFCGLRIILVGGWLRSWEYKLVQLKYANVFCAGLVHLDEMSIARDPLERLRCMCTCEMCTRICWGTAMSAVHPNCQNTDKLILPRTGNAPAALHDARIARTLAPTEHKAWYREGCALAALQQWCVVLCMLAFEHLPSLVLPICIVRVAWASAMEVGFRPPNVGCMLCCNAECFSLSAYARIQAAAAAPCRPFNLCALPSVCAGRMQRELTLRHHTSHQR